MKKLSRPEAKLMQTHEVLVLQYSTSFDYTKS